jgi:hypothetical protein
MARNRNATRERRRVATDAALSILELRHGLELILGRVEDRVVGIPDLVRARSRRGAGGFCSAIRSGASVAVDIGGRRVRVETVELTDSFTHFNAS